MSGGKSPKTKGDNAEREFCRIYGGKRTFWQPDKEKNGGDVYENPILGNGEIKRRKDFKTLYTWLSDNNFLALRGDRKEWLIVIRADKLFELLGRDED